MRVAINCNLLFGQLEHALYLQQQIFTHDLPIT
jgi:hypothetical protein